MPPKLRSLVRTVLLLAAALFVMFTSALMWLAHAANQAKQDVEAFCAQASVGTSSQGLADRARAQGLHVSEFTSPSESSGDVLMAMKGVALARHICTVEHEKGIVTKVERSFLD